MIEDGDNTISADRKRIMILGAGNAVSPLIERAHQIGHETIVVSPKGNYPGFEFADRRVYCDICDVGIILKAAREFGIHGIASVGTDIVVPTIGRVVDELSLKGTGFSSANACSNKLLMKEAFQKGGVRTASGSICANNSQMLSLAESIGFPLMCKAVDSSGSQGVYRVESEGELARSWKNAQQVSPSGTVLFEQFLDGIEFGAQAIVKGDEVIAVFFHNDQVTPPPDHAPIGHSMPCRLDSQILRIARKETVAAIQALGIRDAVVNIDLMLVGEATYVIEVGARIGATCLPETISVFGGFNAYDVVLALALGESVGVDDTANGVPNASRLIQSERDGVLHEICIPSTVLKHPELVRVATYAKSGDSVRRFRVGPDRIGDIIVKGSSVDEAEILASALIGLIEIKFV